MYSILTLFFLVSPQSGPLQLKVCRVPQPKPPDQNMYDTTSDPRGLVLILNYQQFKERPDLLRKGSQYDVINLQNLFCQMGYETQIHWDLTEDQTLNTVYTFRNQERLQYIGCAIIVVMSHGIARQTFHTSDMQCITVDKILSMFLNSECMYLKGKPKIFLFNFCRGTDIPQTVQTDAVRETPRDILCIYSAPEGFLSYRYEETGTPFIISLCQVLSENAHNMSLDDLLRKFKQVYSSAEHGSTPDIQDLNFAKVFYFNPRTWSFVFRKVKTLYSSSEIMQDTFEMSKPYNWMKNSSTLQNFTFPSHPFSSFNYSV